MPSSAEISFPRVDQYHRHLDARRYSVDALTDIICRYPRPVHQLDLTLWLTRRRLCESGQVTAVLVEPTNVEHEFKPEHVPTRSLLPVIVCSRRGRTVLVDGVHRVVTRLMAAETTCACLYVSYRELKRCRMPDGSNGLGLPLKKSLWRSSRLKYGGREPAFKQSA